MSKTAVYNTTVSWKGEHWGHIVMGNGPEVLRLLQGQCHLPSFVDNCLTNRVFAEQFSAGCNAPHILRLYEDRDRYLIQKSIIFIASLYVD